MGSVKNEGNRGNTGNNRMNKGFEGVTYSKTVEVTRGNRGNKFYILPCMLPMLPK